MEFEPNHRNSQCRARCCAVGCNSKMNINLNLSFHKFPKSGLTVEVVNSFGEKETADRQREWLKRLGLITFSKSAVVCSKHFDPSDFYLPDEMSVKRRFLRPNAVPRYTSVTEKEEQLVRSKRKKGLLNRHKENEILMSKDNSERATEDFSFSVPTMKDLNSLNVYETNVMEPESHDDNCEARMMEEMCDNKNNEFTDCQDENVQVKTESFEETLSSFIKTESDLKTICNITSFKVLKKLVELLDAIYPPQGEKLLHTSDCVILTTAKLKLDIPFDALAVFYKLVSERSVRDIFYVTVKRLSAILQSIMRRVSKEEIEYPNVPKFFSELSEKMSILNCTEVEIQKPACLKCQAKFYLRHEGQLRVKFMTEVTQTGLITFLSKTLIGGASYDTIFNHNNVSLESEKDIVDACIEKKIKLIKLPCIKQENLFSEETVTSRNITSAREHIERINKQMRQFKILNNKIPWHMINCVEDIFIICCGLTNLESSILAEDEI